MGKKSLPCVWLRSWVLELVQLIMVKKPIGSDNPNEGKSVVHDTFLSLIPDELLGTDNPYERLKGKSLLHTAIVGRNGDVLGMIWSNDQTLLNSLNAKRSTPLIYSKFWLP